MRLLDRACILSRKGSHSAVAYLLSAVAATWAAWVPAALLSRSHLPLARALHYVGGIALVLTTADFVFLGTPAARAGYVARLRHWRFAGRWWLLLLLLPTGVTVLADFALGNRTAFDPAARQLTSPLSLAVMGAFLLLFGPLPEELSWRGLGLPLLRTRVGPFPATLALAITWAVWHLPLFWLVGSYQWHLGAFTLRFWLYLLAAFSSTFLYTWVWEGTASTIAPLALHFIVNFTGELFEPSLRADALRTALYVGIAIVLSIRWLRSGSSEQSISTRG